MTNNHRSCLVSYWVWFAWLRAELRMQILVQVRTADTVEGRLDLDLRTKPEKKVSASKLPKNE